METTNGSFVEHVNKKYRIGATTKDFADIKLKPSEHLIVNTSRNSNYTPRILETHNIDELKSWIGVPNELFAKRPNCDSLSHDWMPFGVHGTGKDLVKRRKKALSNLKPQDHQKIRELTHAYLYKYAEPLKIYKGLLEQYWERFLIPSWFFNRIYVPNGAVFEISATTAGLFSAYSIEIEQGGKVLFIGSSMTLDVMQIRKV